MKLNNLFYDLLIDLQLPEFYAEILNLILVSVLIFISVFLSSSNADILKLTFYQRKL